MSVPAAHQDVCQFVEDRVDDLIRCSVNGKPIVEFQDVPDVVGGAEVARGHVSAQLKAPFVDVVLLERALHKTGYPRGVDHVRIGWAGASSGDPCTRSRWTCRAGVGGLIHIEWFRQSQ